MEAVILVWLMLWQGATGGTFHGSVSSSEMEDKQ